jgi:hypothetical protein
MSHASGPGTRPKATEEFRKIPYAGAFEKLRQPLTHRRECNASYRKAERGRDWL